MKSSEGLHLKTYCLLFLMVTFGPVGDILLGKGMKMVGVPPAWTPSEILHFFLRAFSSPIVWLGIASLLTYLVCYTLVLSWADFSYVQPASAIAYAIVALLGHFWLGEFVSTRRWIGIGIICFGVLLVGNTAFSTTERR
jgi:drug/metabolite transporter (DMT)-like permease